MRHAPSHIVIATALLQACTETPSTTDAAVDVTSSDGAARDAPTDVSAMSDRPDAAVSPDVASMDVARVDVAVPTDAPLVDVPWSMGISPEGCVMMGGGLCFVRPTATVRTDQGTLDLSCTETPAGVTTMASTAVLRIVDFVTRDPVEGATVAFSADDRFTSIVTGMTGEDGSLNLALPIGSPSRGNFRVIAPGTMDTYSLAGRIDVRDSRHVMQLFSIPTGFTEVVYGGVGAGAQVVGTGVLGGVVDDCNGQAMENVVVTLSSTPSTIEGDLTRWRAPTFVPRAKVFYFEGSAQPAPATRAQRTATSANGLWLILDAPATAGDARWYVQAWGARTAGNVRLMGETRVPVIAGAVVLPEMQAWR